MNVRLASLFAFLVLAYSGLQGQTVSDFVGTYMQIDSGFKSYEVNGVMQKDIDTTCLTLNEDMTFTYTWSPLFGPYSRTHITTTGTWKIHKKKVLLHSKYQEDEYRVIEEYRPEYGDSLVKVYVQTYDSLTGYFPMQRIGVEKDTLRMSKMLFVDDEFPSDACLASFHLNSVDKIVFFGNFGQMPEIIPQNKQSNFFVLQYNLSTNWDYQYFKDYPAKLKKDTLILGEGKGKLKLKKQ